MRVRAPKGFRFLNDSPYNCGSNKKKITEIRPLWLRNEERQDLSVCVLGGCLLLAAAGCSSWLLLAALGWSWIFRFSWSASLCVSFRTFAFGLVLDFLVSLNFQLRVILCYFVCCVLFVRLLLVWFWFGFICFRFGLVCFVVYFISLLVGCVWL